MLYLPDHTLFFKLLFGVRLLLFKLFSLTLPHSATLSVASTTFLVIVIDNDNDHIRADVIRNLIMFGDSADVIDLIACS